MNVAIYLSHPAQYHFFKNPIQSWMKKNHRVLILIRSKDVLADLLDFDEVPYINILPEGRNATSISIVYALIKRIIRLLIYLRPFKPDILIGSDASLPIVARLLRAKSITTIEDDYDVIKPLAMLTFPLTHVILTPNKCQVGKWDTKKIGYPGYMKLSALHPDRFLINHQIIHSFVGNTPYCLIRLSALNAYHDKGKHGLTTEIVNEIIFTCKNHGLNIWINSEKELPPSLKKYQLTFHPTYLHQILAGAKLLISDSQSMTVEASMLGIPSIRYSDFVGKISILEELEHTYHLTKGIPTDSPEKLIMLFQQWINDESLTERFIKLKEKMLLDQIDVANFVAWFVEDYFTNHTTSDAYHRFILANSNINKQLKHNHINHFMENDHPCSYAYQNKEDAMLLK